MTADLIIIGGGASGLVAAIAAGRELQKNKSNKSAPGSRILILERMDKPGKKILATGNGRCNYTNQNMSPACFNSDTPALCHDVLKKFGYNETIRFFNDLGICAKNKDGYMYPLSGQASAILDVLLMEIQELQIKILTNVEVEKIVKAKALFRLYDKNNGMYQCQKVIVACGGCAYPKLGSNGSGYAIAKAFGHTIVPPVPSLTGLYTKEKYFKTISGVRVDGTISLFKENQWIASDRGEIQMTDYGISGIPVFQVSRHAAKALANQAAVWANIDFMPDVTSKDLIHQLYNRIKKHPSKTAQDLLIGVFNQKLCHLFIQLSHIPPQIQASKINRGQLESLVDFIKQLRFQIVKTGDFSSAQVCAGGIYGRELTDCMASIPMPGVYFTGELVDVDGICGGYNLQWAWASGFVAGQHAGKELL